MCGSCSQETMSHTPIKVFFGFSFCLKKPNELQQFTACTSADVSELTSVRAWCQLCKIWLCSAHRRGCTGLDEKHISQIRDFRLNGHTFHGSLCNIWVDVGISSTKMYPLSTSGRQMGVRGAHGITHYRLLFLSVLTSIRKWKLDLICELDFTVLCSLYRLM